LSICHIGRSVATSGVCLFLTPKTQNEKLRTLNEQAAEFDDSRETDSRRVSAAILPRRPRVLKLHYLTTGLGRQGNCSVPRGKIRERGKTANIYNALKTTIHYGDKILVTAARVNYELL